MTQSWINRRTVKWLALSTMLIDHIGGSLMQLHPEWYDHLLVLRSIGRLAFPLFAFQMGLTFSKTKDLKKLLTTLFILALLSEIPYDLRGGGSWLNLGSQNVVWNFWLVGLFLLAREGFNKTFSPVKAQVYQVLLGSLLALIAQYAGIDYGLKGFVMVLLFTLVTDQLAKAVLPLILFEDWWVKYSLILVPLLLIVYDDRPIRFGKWEGAFYHYFYPLHLVVLYWFLK